MISSAQIGRAWTLSKFRAWHIVVIGLHFLTAMQVDMARKTSFVDSPEAIQMTQSFRSPSLEPRTISGCVGPLYGENINPQGIMAWLHYYEKRWGLTHVEIHIQEEDFEYVHLKLNKAHMESRDSKFIQSVTTNFHVVPNWISVGERRSLATMTLNQCHGAAAARGSDYLIAFDPDEYLVSDDFTTLDELFEHYGTPGIVFPIFNAHYNVCQRRKPTFDSVTYRSVVPHGSTVDTEHPEQLYTDPPHGYGGNQKYIVRPNKFPHLAHVHVPLHDWDKHREKDLLTYLDGRGRGTKIVHLRSSVGLHADNHEFLCTSTPQANCRYYDWVTKKCVQTPGEAKLVLDPTEINTILADVPLNEPSMRIYRQATCYAKKDQTLHTKYCQGDNFDNCKAEKLITRTEVGFNDCVTS